jgi:hypothetical protein
MLRAGLINKENKAGAFWIAFPPPKLDDSVRRTGRHPAEPLPR